MKQMTPHLRLGGLVLGMLMAITSCRSDMKPVEVVSAPPIDTPDLRERAATASSVPAFPGAEGFGANSVGGRGGRVIEVINLNDSGPGSLRAAVEARGPRIVVFRTGGTIELQEGLLIDNPFITIAGQTAPGGGIALKNADTNPDAALTVRTHDVIIRYIRSRPGPTAVETRVQDAIQVLGEASYNVIIDHCSASWATDEVVSTWYAPHNITIQWCIISEGLNNSTHIEGHHSCGVILGSAGSYNISFHHNLLVHNGSRHPRIRTTGVVDVVNNVIYNHGAELSYGDNTYGPLLVNYVGNLVKYGPDSSSSQYFIKMADWLGEDPTEVYVQGNITPRRPSDDMDEDLVVDDRFREYIVEARHDAPLVTTTSAFEAYDQVLADAGANLPTRDVVDERIVNDVINGAGRIIDDPSEVGGWPQLAAGTVPADTDHDGMPDEWEYLYGLNPNDPSDGTVDVDGDGYTNVEEYLNGTEPIDMAAIHRHRLRPVCVAL